MIEIRMVPSDDWGGVETSWWPATPQDIIKNINFKIYEVRIDGVVYTEETEEFKEAFNKAKLWMQLSE